MSKQYFYPALGVALYAVVAYFDLFGSSEGVKAMPKADAPGTYTDFNKNWGPAVRQSAGVDERFHGMQQIPFGLHSKTETITLMLADTATAFGLSVAADTQGNLLFNLAVVPSEQCDPTSTFLSKARVLAGGKEIEMLLDCLQTDKGLSQIYQPVERAQALALQNYLEQSETAVITYPGYGAVAFDMTGFDAAIEIALKHNPRVVGN